MPILKPEDYPKFIAIIEGYLHEAGVQGNWQDDEGYEPELPGNHTAVAESYQQIDDAAKFAKFIMMEHKKGGYKCVENYLERFDQYQKASEVAFQQGAKAPKLKLLGYEKAMAAELYPAIEEREYNVARRFFLATAGLTVTTLASYAAGENPLGRVIPKTEISNEKKQPLPKLAGIIMGAGYSVTAWNLIDEFLSSKKEKKEKKEALIQFLELNAETISSVMSDLNHRRDR